MSDFFSLSFDPGSLAGITRLVGFKALLNPQITLALTQSGSTIAQAAIDNTWEVFENPTGELASTIYPWLASPNEMEIRVDSPYARRREFGFQDMTDSLGRTFPHDVAKPYLQPALDANEPAVLQSISDAVMFAWGEVGG